MQSSPLLELQRAAGARVQDALKPALVLTFGDVPGEYRAGLAGCALFDATTRGLVRVRGEDAAALLHRILAGDVRSRKPGQGSRNLLLSSKGKVLFDFDLSATDDGYFLSTTPGRSAALLQAIDTYLFAEKVTLEDESERHAPLDLCGPSAVDVLREVTGVEPPTEDHRTIEGVAAGEPVRVTHLPVAGSPGWRVDCGPDAADDLWEALVERGARPAGAVARDSLRVEACAALDGVDIDDNVYPQEARLESAFSLEKGCYIGQEVVAKIDTYGGLNKRLVALRIDHGDPLARGTTLMRVDDGERREVGLVTSWAWSFALDTGLVLAYVKRRSQAVGTELVVGDTAAVATIVPLPVREGALPVTGEFE